MYLISSSNSDSISNFVRKISITSVYNPYSDKYTLPGYLVDIWKEQSRFEELPLETRIPAG